jgi:hypothetical protein
MVGEKIGLALGSNEAPCRWGCEMSWEPQKPPKIVRRGKKMFSPRVCVVCGRKRCVCAHSPELEFFSHCF